MVIVDGATLSKLASIKPNADTIMTKALLDFAFTAEKEMDRQGLTRTELAKRLNVNKSSVSRVLSATQNISLETMARYCAELGLEIIVKKTRSR